MDVCLDETSSQHGGVHHTSEMRFFGVFLCFFLCVITRWVTVIVTEATWAVGTQDFGLLTAGQYDQRSDELYVGYNDFSNIELGMDDVDPHVSVVFFLLKGQ